MEFKISEMIQVKLNSSTRFKLSEEIMEWEETSMRSIQPEEKNKGKKKRKEKRKPKKPVAIMKLSDIHITEVPEEDDKESRKDI